MAQIEIRYAPMQLRPPKRLKGDALPLWATHAIESDPPAECEAVAWLLLTTVPTPTLENAFERLGWQAARWNIEVRIPDETSRSVNAS